MKKLTNKNIKVEYLNFNDIMKEEKEVINIKIENKDKENKYDRIKK